MTLTATELAARYALLCRSTQADTQDDPRGAHLASHLSALRTLLRHDLRALGRQGSPDDFADICFELEQELERFQEFCAFPPLAQKFVVAFGGGFSAGKSSLINALLGKRLLVTEVDPTTSLPTYLLKGPEDAIHAQNLFGHHVELSDEEFLSLTHDELARYGSNVSRLLRSAIISRQDFPWQNLALIDTPGYTKHEDQQHSERTDEHIARTQLNSAQAIVWVIDARQGCITEDDIKFLASLRPEIPRLIALSRADQKPSEDIADILKGIRATLETRNLPFLDVVAVSARKKDWPFTPILEQLARWNGAPRALRFAHNFKHQFTRYSGHLDDERRQAQQHLNRLNRILGLSDEEAIQEDARELKNKTNGQLQTAERLQSELGALRHRFFAELKLVGDHVGIAMPEPSALDLLDDVAGFNLLDALRQLREAEGKPAPDEPASLRELGQPGETPKITAFLNGETDVALDSHFAADLDIHCRETYARFLAAVIGHGQAALSEMQGALFLKLLESLGLPDIRVELLAQAREIIPDELQDFLSVIDEHKLNRHFLFDSLILCRSGDAISSENMRLLAELGAILDLETKTVAGLSALAGRVSGIHCRTELLSPEIVEIRPWVHLIFKNFEKYKEVQIKAFKAPWQGIKFRAELISEIRDMNYSIMDCHSYGNEGFFRKGALFAKRVSVASDFDRLKNKIERFVESEISPTLDDFNSFLREVGCKTLSTNIISNIESISSDSDYTGDDWCQNMEEACNELDEFMNDMDSLVSSLSDKLAESLSISSEIYR